MVTRRLFVISASVGALGSFGGCSFGSNLFGSNKKILTPIAIVGAGVAGLTCGYELKRAGVEFKIFEAASRVGGRVCTFPRDIGGDQRLYSELGAEFIDTDHKQLLNLIKDLGLELIDTNLLCDGSECKDVFIFDGQIVSEADLIDRFSSIRPIINNLAKEFSVNPEKRAEFDKISLSEFLHSTADIDPLIREVISVSYTAEFGLEPSEQSSLNLIEFIDSNSLDSFNIFGKSDEGFKIKGGNSRLTEELSKKLKEELVLSCCLQSIKQKKSGLYRLSFDYDGANLEVETPIVVLALPFSVLRDVDIDLDLPQDKNFIISTLGYGTNSKLIGSFSSRVWRDGSIPVNSGITDAANGDIQNFWDASLGQSLNGGSKQGDLTFFSGGKAGINLLKDTADKRFAELLKEMPGSLGDMNPSLLLGSVLRADWPRSTFSRGSYACFKPGQYRYQSAISEVIGNLYFCGEHCSVEYQGFIEGACQTGVAVAQSIRSGKSGR